MDEKHIERLKKELTRSLIPVPNELNELDWKIALSDNNERLNQHLSAFANYPGGGFLVFGINPFGVPAELSSSEIQSVIDRIANIGRDGLVPPVQIQHTVFVYEDVPLLGIFIPESPEKPVRRRGKSIEQSFIRSGGQTRKMSEHELRVSLITSRSLRFEEIQGIIPIDLKDPLNELCDFSAVFKRLQFSSASQQGTEEFLHSQKLLNKNGSNTTPTNLAILCCARDFSKIPGYERLSVRVVQYRGLNKVFAQKDRFFKAGYTLNLDEIVRHILDLMPHSEIIKDATRIETSVIPEIAIREVVANAVIHRDYTKTDGYVTVDIYDDRIEVTNPGGLLPEIPIDRLIGHPSRTRNEVLADFMRKLNFCEERGSGMIKVATAMEVFGLPAAEFDARNDHFKVTLWRPKDFAKMEKPERISAVYQHACLNKLVGRKTTNSTVRERFRFKPDQTVKATRLLNDALEAGRIKIANPDASPRDTHYLPYWA